MNYYTMNNEVITYYDKLAENYDLDRFENSYGKFIDKQERKILGKLLKSIDSENVLDLACGTGRLLNKAQFGVDASENMIKIAKKKFPNKSLRVSDASNTGFENEQFDAIFSFHLLMHLSKDKIIDIFDEAYRILNKNGRFIFDIPSKKRRKLFKYKTKTWHGATSFSEKELKRIFGNNWKIKRYYGILFLPIHRFPRFIRKTFLFLDNVLCKSFLKEYSSYLIFEVEKK